VREIRYLHQFVSPDGNVSKLTFSLEEVPVNIIILKLQMMMREFWMSWWRKQNSISRRQTMALLVYYNNGDGTVKIWNIF